MFNWFYLILNLILKYIYDYYLNFNDIYFFISYLFWLLFPAYSFLLLLFMLFLNLFYFNQHLILNTSYYKHILFLLFSFIVLFFQVIYLIIIDLNFMLFLILLPAYYWLYSKHNLTVLANPVLTWFYLILILFLHFSILFHFSSYYWSQF